jgi:hypothetical protein
MAKAISETARMWRVRRPPLPDGGPALAFPQGEIQIRPGSLEGGRGADQNGRREGDRQRKQQDADIDFDRIGVWKSPASARKSECRRTSNAMPSTPPAKPSSPLSTSNCRIKRRRPAPSDARTANSVRRVSVRACRRFAALTQAISKDTDNGSHQRVEIAATPA